MNNRWNSFTPEEQDIIGSALSLYVDKVLPQSYVSTEEHLINNMFEELSQSGK